VYIVTLVDDLLIKAAKHYRNSHFVNSLHQWGVVRLVQHLIGLVVT
jgi:hypothetical protein